MTWEWFGYLASACFILCGIPQLFMCIKQGHGKGLSQLFMWVWFAGEAFLLVYAFYGLHMNIPLMLNAGFCFLICMLILRYMYFPRTQKRRRRHGKKRRSKRAPTTVKWSTILS